MLPGAAGPPPLPPGRAGTLFDSQMGFALRRWCAPLIDLERHAPIDAYLTRRAELGAAEVNRRLVAATGIGTFLVDTGYLPEPITSPDELAALAGGAAREVVRLEAVGEQGRAGRCSAARVR